MGKYQSLDYRVAVITGSTIGVTGGDIIPNGYIGVVKHISESDIANTGQNITVRTQPSGTNLDARRLAAQGNWPDSLEFDEDAVQGIIGQNNCLQVIGSASNVIARIVYVIEEGRASG